MRFPYWIWEMRENDHLEHNLNIDIWIVEMAVRFELNWWNQVGPPPGVLRTRPEKKESSDDLTTRLRLKSFRPLSCCAYKRSAFIFSCAQHLRSSSNLLSFSGLAETANCLYVYRITPISWAAAVGVPLKITLSLWFLHACHLLL